MRQGSCPSTPPEIRELLFHVMMPFGSRFSIKNLVPTPFSRPEDPSAFHNVEHSQSPPSRQIARTTARLAEVSLRIFTMMPHL